MSSQFVYITCENNIFLVISIPVTYIILMLCLSLCFCISVHLNRNSVSICRSYMICNQRRFHFTSLMWCINSHTAIYIKRTNVTQLGSTFICNCNIALRVSDAFCVHLQEQLATVEAASGE